MLANYGLILDVEGDDIDNIVYNPLIGKSFLNTFLFKRIELEKLLRSKIDEVHEAAKKAGKTARFIPNFFQGYLEDRDPDYCKFVIESFKEDIDKFNDDLKKENYLMYYYLDENLDIRAYLRYRPNVNIGIKFH